ncbi:hypothetical protein Sjap_010962 [Stephania japonica]|uniref:Uncharacterized protein n=1 Tax=Stephania japonica TaxID=461633 RepID=A0AAP0JBG3_9MAGN
MVMGDMYEPRYLFFAGYNVIVAGTTTTRLVIHDFYNKSGLPQLRDQSVVIPITYAHGIHKASEVGNKDLETMKRKLRLGAGIVQGRWSAREFSTVVQRWAGREAFEGLTRGRCCETSMPSISTSPKKPKLPMIKNPLEKLHK